MSTIILTVLRCPDSVVSEQRQAQGGEITLGRSAECNWQLADPDRVLSKKHCVVEFFSGGWQARDLSTNGTFVNYGTPVGRDQARPLLDGDRLQLGPYEIEVRIVNETSSRAGISGWSRAPSFPSVPPRFDLTGTHPDLDDLQPGTDHYPVSRLPGDLDLGIDNDVAISDHTSAHADVFIPPSVVAVGQPLIPDNWDHEIDSEDLSPSPQVGPPLQRAGTAVEPATDRSDEPDLSGMAPLNPFHEPDDGLSQPACANDQAHLNLPPADAIPTIRGTTDIVALLEGAGLPVELAARAITDPDETLRRAGVLLRLAVTGLRSLLVARSDVKREFRIEQTVLRLVSNNPLKFSTSEEQALVTLLDPYTPAVPAMQEALHDLKSHQVATLTATQAAARALLEQLAPMRIEADDPGGSLFPGAREKRLWEAYQRRHAQLTEQFEDDFDSAFGKAFARAYEAVAGQSQD